MPSSLFDFRRRLSVGACGRSTTARIFSTFPPKPREIEHRLLVHNTAMLLLESPWQTYKIPADYVDVCTYVYTVSKYIL